MEQTPTGMLAAARLPRCRALSNTAAIAATSSRAPLDAQRAPRDGGLARILFAAAPAPRESLGPSQCDSGVGVHKSQMIATFG